MSSMSFGIVVLKLTSPNTIRYRMTGNVFFSAAVSCGHNLCGVVEHTVRSRIFCLFI